MERFKANQNFQEISHVVAMSKNGIIGKNGIMPWNLPEDLARFKYLTIGKTVIMGRKTYDNLPQKLLYRKVVVITSSKDYKGEVLQYKSLKKSLKELKADKYIMISGGESIYRQSLDIVSVVYLTLVDSNFEGDSHYFTMNELLKKFRIDYKRTINTEPGCSFMRLVRI